MNRKIDLEYKKRIRIFGIDKTQIVPYHKKFDFNRFSFLNQALITSGIGYFEWDIKKRLLYLTKIVFEYCNVSEDFDGSYLELLSVILNREELHGFIEQLKVLLTGLEQENIIEIKIYSNTHKSDRWIKITSELITDENDNKLIFGMMQDITELKLAKDKAEEAKETLNQILDVVPIPIIYIGKDETIQMYNTAATESLKFELGNPIGKREEDYRAAFSGNYNLLDKKVVFQNENHLKYELHADCKGAPLSVLVDKKTVSNNKGESIGTVIVHTDITQSVQNIRNITKSLKANELSIEIKEYIENVGDLKELYNFILKRISEVIPSASHGYILRLDDDNNLYIAANIGYDQEYADSFSIPFAESFANTDLQGDYNRSIIVNDIQNRFVSLYPDIDIENRGFILDTSMIAPICINGELYGIVSIDSDQKSAFDEVDLNLIDYLRIQIERSINRHKKLQSVVAISRQDELTGIFNRRYLLEIFDNYLKHADWNGENICFVVFDIDDLKIINDHYGHLAGDMALKQFAGLVMTETRSDDIFARYGGDEFIGLFPNTTEKALRSKIEKWKVDLEHAKFSAGDEFVNVRFSYGIATYPEEGINFESLMSTADRQMYRNKENK